MAGAVEAGHTLDLDARRARTLDARAHLVEAVGEVHHLRLAGGVLDHARPVGESGGHEGDMRAADGDLREGHLPPRSPFFVLAMT